jgi:hypothetical protein
MRLLDYCGSKVAISAPDDPRSWKQPARSTGKPGHNGRTGRLWGAAARMTRDHSGQRHPRTPQKDRQHAKPTARGGSTRPGRTTRKPTRPMVCLEVLRKPSQVGGDPVSGHAGETGCGGLGGRFSSALNGRSPPLRARCQGENRKGWLRQAAGSGQRPGRRGGAGARRWPAVVPARAGERSQTAEDSVRPAPPQASTRPQDEPRPAQDAGWYGLRWLVPGRWATGAGPWEWPSAVLPWAAARWTRRSRSALPLH